METGKIWAIVVISIIAVYFGVFLIIKSSQDRENEKAVLEILEEQDRQVKIDQCNNLAYERYSQEWDNTCLLIGRYAGCSLPAYYADELDKSYNAELDRCIVRYSY